VAVATSAPHRRAAFEAAEWLMERIKREVPIWKREEGPEGPRAWEHPGGPPPAPGGGAV
jgi:molybdopterin synthase catalytic subunit